MHTIIKSSHVRDTMPCMPAAVALQNAIHRGRRPNDCCLCFMLRHSCVASGPVLSTAPLAAKCELSSATVAARVANDWSRQIRRVNECERMRRYVYENLDVKICNNYTDSLCIDFVLPTATWMKRLWWLRDIGLLFCSLPEGSCWILLSIIRHHLHSNDHVGPCVHVRRYHLVPNVGKHRKKQYYKYNAVAVLYVVCCLWYGQRNSREIMQSCSV